MTRRSLLVLSLLLVLAAACGDDGGGWQVSTTASTTSAPPTTTTTTAPTTTAPTTTTTTTSPPTTTTTEPGGGDIEDADDLVDAMVAQMAVPDSPFDEEAARCVAEGVVEEIGFERLVDIGAADLDADAEEIFSRMTEDEIGTIADVALACIDMHALFVSQFVSQGIPEEIAVCVADGLAGAPWLSDMLVAAMLGEEPDIMGDPEALSTILSLVSQCGADE